MRDILLVGVCLLTLVQAAQAEGNVLVGRWKAADATCGSSYLFTPKTQTTMMRMGGTSSVEVTYNLADPHKVFVIGNTGSALGFYVLDANTIRLSTYPGCTYKRQ